MIMKHYNQIVSLHYYSFASNVFLLIFCLDISN